MSVLDPPYGWHGNTYTPRPEEIAAECERIRNGWTAAERRRRAPHLAEAERVRFPSFVVDNSVLAFSAVESFAE